MPKNSESVTLRTRARRNDSEKGLGGLESSGTYFSTNFRITEGAGKYGVSLQV